MSDDYFDRVIVLSTHFYEGPPQWSFEEWWGDELHLAPNLVESVKTWYGAVVSPFDEKNPSAPAKELTAEDLDEAARIAQSIADEMGSGVTVLFEKRRFVSFAPPTNSRARQALEDHIREWHPGMNDDVREMWWAADWPPPPPPRWI